MAEVCKSLGALFAFSLILLWPLLLAFAFVIRFGWAIFIPAGIVVTLGGAALIERLYYTRMKQSHEDYGKHPAVAGYPDGEAGFSLKKW